MLTREHKEESLWAWTCHNCEHAGMTRFIPQCPECQHPRCQHCLSKCIKIGKPYSTPTIFYNEENSNTLSSRGISINVGAHNDASPSTWARNPNNGIETESSAKVLDFTALENTRVNPCELKILENSPQCSSTHSQSTRKLKPIPALHWKDCSSVNHFDRPPKPAPSSRSFSGTLSPRTISAISETDMEVEMSDSEDGQSGDYAVETWYPKHAKDILESRLFSLLGYDLALASHLLPWICDQVKIVSQFQEAFHKTAPSHETSGNFQNQQSACGFLSSSTMEGPNTSQHPKQHKRRADNEEDEDQQDQGNSKRPKPGLYSLNVDGPRFACHFHKKDPMRYAAQASKKYRACSGPGYTEFHRIKGHLETHRLWQCQRCYVVCADMHELVHHRSEPCSENPPSPQEGIDDIQWGRICVTLKAKKRLTGIYKLESERSKWFEVWDILFPTFSRPTHPWYENTQPTIISRDLDNCLAVFENTIESDIRQGILQRNDETHQRYVNAFRQAYATESIVSMHRQSLSLSLTESNDAATGTPESSNYFVSPDTSSREMLDRMMTTQAFPDAQDYQGSGYHGTGNVPGYISPSFSFPMLSVNGPSLQTLQSPAIQDLLTDMPLNSFTVDGTLQSTLTSEEPSLGFPSITDANNALNSRTTQQNSTDILDQNLDLDEFITMAFD